MGIHDEVNAILQAAEARHDEAGLRHYFDEQDRIMALLAPAELAAEERDSIRTAYDRAADWYGAEHPLDFATFVVGWLECMKTHPTTPPPPKS